MSSLVPYVIHYKQVTRSSSSIRGGNYTRVWTPGFGDPWEPL